MTAQVQASSLQRKGKRMIIALLFNAFSNLTLILVEQQKGLKNDDKR